MPPLVDRAPSVTVGSPDLVLEVQSVDKSFGQVDALRSAKLRISAAEGHALLGANGAGKSTLVKIVTGVQLADRGRLLWQGAPVRLTSVLQARQLGIGAVFQEPALARDLTVDENLRLLGVVHSVRQRFERRRAELGIEDLPLRTRVGDIPLSRLRAIDFARCLSFEPQLLVLDELTAELPHDLSERVEAIAGQFRRTGGSILYVSHRLSEIRRLCTVATILRNGEVVADAVPLAECTDKSLLDQMLGDVAELARQPQVRKRAAFVDAAPVLEVQNLTFQHKVRKISLSVKPGEVVGVAALEDQGAVELFECIAGVAKADNGQVCVGGKQLRTGSIVAAINAGLVFVPAERGRGLLPTRSVFENVGLALDNPIHRWLGRGVSKHTVQVSSAIEHLSVDARAGVQAQRLSGGNQQKLIIARWLATGFRVLLAFDPTRGIDIITREDLYKMVRELSGAGTAILWYSSELSELVTIADRVVVVYSGEVRGSLEGADITEARLLEVAHGLEPDPTTPKIARLLGADRGTGL